MASYSNPYYDPQKAHEYYEEHKQLKGYEGRYDNTDRSRGGSKYQIPTISRETSELQARYNISKARTDASSKKVAELSSQIKALRNKLNSMSDAEKRKNRSAIQSEIKKLSAQLTQERQALKQLKQTSDDENQRLKQQTPGGSTSGFNAKGRAKAESLKKQIKDDITSENKALDSKYLPKLEAIKRRIKGGSDNESIKSAIQQLYAALSDEKKKNSQSFQQRYRDELDKIRNDDSLYTYWDRRNKSS